MKPLFASQLLPLAWAFRFYSRYFAIIIGISLFAALGRIIQFQAFGSTTTTLYWSIEVLVELSRVVVFILIIGYGNLSRGIQAVGKFFRRKRTDFNIGFEHAKEGLRRNWKTIVVNFILFSMIAVIFNLLLDKSAVCIVWADIFKGINPLQSGSASTQFIFFVKNLTIIPFTLIFEIALIAFVLGKLKEDRK